jgi:hypothetical protein
MAIRRTAIQVFPIEKAQVVERVSQVLQSKDKYRRVSKQELDNETIFITSVKPNFILLATEMRINIKVVESGTSVEVLTVSQLFIIGDAFRLYDRYIRDFQRDLEEELRTEPLRETSPISRASTGPEIVWTIISLILFVATLVVLLPVGPAIAREFDSSGSGGPALIYLIGSAFAFVGAFAVALLVDKLVRSHL